MISPTQLLRNLRYKVFCWIIDDVITRKILLQTYGNICPWTIHSDYLVGESIVLSAGAGNDISFEKNLIEKFGLKVLLLDPSPTGRVCVEKADISPNNLRFLPAALTGIDGLIRMRRPKNPAEGSYVTVANQTEGEDFISRSVSSLMEENGWKYIDLLKMDIEGSEYEVVHQILAQRLNIKQICVEFHYGPDFHINRTKMFRTIIQLIFGGYDLVHRAAMDHTFVKRDATDSKR